MENLFKLLTVVNRNMSLHIEGLVPLTKTYFVERFKILFCDNVKFFCFSSNYDTPPTVDLSDLKVETERRVDKGQPSHILQNKFKSALSTLPYSDPSTPEAAGTY